MSYSYTEKKRIRKNFGTFAKVMDLPNLIETQTKSYSEFLQADVAPEARKKQGLEEVFKSLFPIKSVSGNAALEYVSYELGKNTYDVQECLIVKVTNLPEPEPAGLAHELLAQGVARLARHLRLGGVVFRIIPTRAAEGPIVIRAI